MIVEGGGRGALFSSLIIKKMNNFLFIPMGPDYEKGMGGGGEDQGVSRVPLTKDPQRSSLSPMLELHLEASKGHWGDCPRASWGALP